MREFVILALVGAIARAGVAHARTGPRGDAMLTVPSLSLGGLATPEATLWHGASVQGLAMSVEGFIASAGGRGAKRLVVWRPASSSS